MATDAPRTPPPDAGGARMSRRTLLKAGAGAAAVGAVTTRAGPLEELSPVGGANAIAPLIAYAAVGVGGGTALGYLYGTTLSGAIDVVEANIAEDELSAHQSARSEMENYLIDVVQIENTLKDTETLAHQEARDEIATAWESGAPASEATSGALARIDQYYAERVENNWIEINAKSALQHAHAMQKALDAVLAGGESKDQSNPWTFGLFEHPTYGSSTWSEIKTETSEVEITLKDGASKTVELPNILVEWNDGSVSKTVNLGELLNDYDRNGNGDFGFDIDGERATWVNKAIDIPNIPEANVAGYTVQHFEDDYVRIRDMIRSQADTVRGNYSQSLVEDIYAELDAGNITPNQVRGIDGQARFLSNTEDATADAYQLALLQQLGMEQADLSKIASMAATYTGYEGLDVQKTESGQRQIWPGTHVDSTEYEGLLFAQKVPSGGLDVGSTYICDPVAYVGDDKLAAIGIDGGVLWTQSGFGKPITHTAASPDAKTVYVATGDSNGSSITAVSTEDGSTQWSGGVGRFDVDVDPQGGYVVGCDGTNTVALSTEDGSQQWSVSDGGRSVITSPDGSTVYVSGGSDTIYEVNASDGSSSSFTTHSGGTSCLGMAPDGSAVYVGDSNGGTGGNLTAYDPSDGSQLWSTSTASTCTDVITPDGNRIYIGTQNDGVRAYDVELGSFQWSVGGIDYPNIDCVRNTVIATETSTANIYVIDGSGNTVFSDSNTLTYQEYDTPGCGVAYSPHSYVGGASGVLAGAYFYDSPTSEEYMLENGLLTFTSMSDQDGNDVRETSTEDWGRPEYDQADTSAWADYMEQTKQYRDSLDQYDLGDPPLIGGGGGGSWWPPGWWPSWLPSDPLLVIGGAIASFIGINAATN